MTFKKRLINRCSHHVVTIFVSPIHPFSLYCLCFLLIHSFIHSLSLTLCLGVCLTAIGSCLFAYLYYQWCNQTGQSHRPALTLADIIQTSRVRETERERQTGKRRQEAKIRNNLGNQIMWGSDQQWTKWSVGFCRLNLIKKLLNLDSTWLFSDGFNYKNTLVWLVIWETIGCGLPYSWPSVRPAGDQSQGSPWQWDKVTN